MHRKSSRRLLVIALVIAGGVFVMTRITANVDPVSPNLNSDNGLNIRQSRNEEITGGKASRQSKPKKSGATRYENPSDLIGAINTKEVNFPDFGEIISELGSSMSDDELVNFFSLANGITNTNNKAEVTSLIIGQISGRLGHNYALDLVESNDGVTRNRQMSSVFANGDLNLSEFLTSYQDLNDGDRTAATVGFLVTFSTRDDLHNSLSLLSKASLDPFVENQLLRSLRYRFASRAYGTDDERSGDARSIFNSVVELWRAGGVSDTFFGEMFQQVNREQPIESSVQSLLKIREKMDPAAYEKLLGQLASSHVSDNPASNLLKLKVVAGITAKDLNVMIVAGVQSWMQKEPSEASKWMAANTDKLPPSVRGQVSEALAIQFANSNNFKDAWSWIDNIQDSEAKAKAGAEILNAERVEVERKAKSNPGEFILELASGNTDHGTHWIEEAYREWAETDANGAWSWYDENSGKLESSQSQFIAKFYAKEAIKLGEFETAREWLGRIEDQNSVKELTKLMK